MLTHLVLALLMATPPTPSLLTTADQSGLTRTGRYDEVIRLCAAFPSAYRGKVRCETFGQTPEGRPMLALVASADGVLDPAKARARKRPVVLAQGGIHAGEIDGKDAGFWLLRDLLDGKAGKGVLSALTLVFVPVFNVDGHERFGPNNRPNQVGPEQMGYRVTAQNLNLNRDYAKADAPEMRAMLGLLDRWDPIAYVDLHATDGAQFQHDVAVMLEPSRGGPAVMREPGTRFSTTLMERLQAGGHLPLDFYPSFTKDDDPSSGFRAGLGLPRFSTFYWEARNRYAVLVETHSWKDYPTRVKATYDVVLATLEHVRDHGAALTAAAAAADQEDRSGKEEAVTLSYEVTGAPIQFDFQGFAYTIEPSEISGQPWIRYDPTRPQVWKVPVYRELSPAMVVSLPPGAGYIVPAGYASPVKERLVAHGLEHATFEASFPAVPVKTFRADSVTFGAAPYEGRFSAKVTGRWADERRDIPRGSLFVPASQPGRRLVAHLFEPAAPDSLVSWGFFNATFERKEGMEDYVTEAEARRMLASDPKLKAHFEGALKDPLFAKSPAKRLELFARRHPSWDDRFRLCPVYRVDAPPPLK